VNAQLVSGISYTVKTIPKSIYKTTLGYQKTIILK